MQNISSNIYLCGDTHGKIDIEKINKWNPEEEHKYLIVLGDWGGLWFTLDNNLKGYKRDKKALTNLMKKAKNKNFSWIIVPGNHDNWDMILQLPEKEMFGAKVRYLNVYHYFHREFLGEIIFLNRGEIYNIEGKTFWAFGGALSSDINTRTEGYDYWKQELPSLEEMSYGITNLHKNNWSIDHVLTHTCPYSIIEDLIGFTHETKSNDPLAFYFHKIYEKLDFKSWHFGHFHEDKILDHRHIGKGIFQCHYNEEPFRLK